MTSTELKLRAERIQHGIEQVLKAKYESFSFGNRLFFCRPDGLTFSLFYMGGGEWDAFGVEYANNRQEAEQFMLDDGDLFYIDDMTESDLLNAICQEIEGVELE